MLSGLGLVQAGVEALADVDVSALPLEAVQQLALQSEQFAQQLRGIASRALGVVAVQQDTAAWWWRDALTITGEAAGRAVRRACDLQSLPAVADAVVEGRLSLEQAGALTPLVGRIDEAELADSQESYLQAAEGCSVDTIGQWVRHQIALHSEPALVLEQDRARDLRMLKHRLCPDGTVRGRFVLAGEDAESFLTVLEGGSRRQGTDDRRDAGQRRADCLVGVFDAAARDMDLPQAGGRPVQVSYVVDAEWARGVQGAVPPVGAWTGPQTRPRVEAVLCDARISRVLVDGVGQVVGLESLTDQVTAAQRRALVARDVHCVARGCSRPPASCDAHHLIARADGGPTTLDNLVLLCRRHHVMWHQGRLVLAQLRVPWLRRPDDPPMVA